MCEENFIREIKEAVEGKWDEEDLENTKPKDI